MFHNKYKPIEFASYWSFHTGVFKFKLYVVYKRKTKKNTVPRKVKDKGQKKYPTQILNQASVIMLMTVKQQKSSKWKGLRVKEGYLLIKENFTKNI